MADYYASASVLSKAGTEEAEQLQRKALSCLRRHLGEDHPQTLQGLSSLATCLGDRGATAEAEQLLRRVLLGLSDCLNPEDPQILRALGNLGDCLADQGKDAQAEAAYREAMALAQRVKGPKSLCTVEMQEAAEALAGFLKVRGRTTEAALLLRLGGPMAAPRIWPNP